MEQIVKKTEQDEGVALFLPMKWFWISLIFAFLFTAVVTFFWPDSAMADFPFLICLIVLMVEKIECLSYFKVFLYTMTTSVAIFLSISLAWCCVILLWPDRLTPDTSMPFSPPETALKTILVMGLYIGITVSFLQCAFKWQSSRPSKSKKHPLVAAMEPGVGDERT